MVVFETDAWHFRYFPLPKTETLSYPTSRQGNSGYSKITHKEYHAMSLRILL